MDSMTRHLSRGTIDTVLSVATEAELDEYFGGRAKLDPGKVWDGIFKPVLDALDRATRDEVLGNIERYGNELASSEASPGPAGSLAFHGSVEQHGGEELHEPGPMTAAKMGDQYRRFWADRLGQPAPTRDSFPRGKRVTVADIQRANDAFWNARKAENEAILPPRPWGKG
jgi:hypothetical protein